MRTFLLPAHIACSSDPALLPALLAGALKLFARRHGSLRRQTQAGRPPGDARVSMGMVGTEVAGRGWEDVRKEHYAESQKQRTGRVALMLVISGCTGNRTPAARSRARPARISHAVLRALWERRANKPKTRHPEDSRCTGDLKSRAQMGGRGRSGKESELRRRDSLYTPAAVPTVDVRYSWINGNGEKRAQGEREANEKGKYASEEPALGEEKGSQPLAPKRRLFRAKPQLGDSTPSICSCRLSNQDAGNLSSSPFGFSKVAVHHIPQVERGRDRETERRVSRGIPSPSSLAVLDHLPPQFLLLEYRIITQRLLQVAIEQPPQASGHPTTQCALLR